jgi:hypothetical protein
MFTTKLIVSEHENGSWRLEQPLVYVGAKEQFTVPAGFLTDFASVPKMFWNIIPPTGKHTKAAVLHDWFYREPTGVSQKDGDGIFRRIMREEGVGKSKRYVMWSMVRMFGWRSYQK